MKSSGSRFSLRAFQNLANQTIKQREDNLMRLPLVALLSRATLLLCFLSSLPAMAAAACMAPHPLTGQIVKVHEISLPGTVGVAWALSNVDATGYPTITYFRQFFALPPLMQEFTRVHECAHHHVGPDEVQANCTALVEMREHGLTAAQEEFIARFHIGLGPLPAQYFGSGDDFWQMTIECAGERPE
jgi:hypothetical protein